MPEWDPPIFTLLGVPLGESPCELMGELSGVRISLGLRHFYPLGDGSEV